jgi:hypothetical protein
MNLTSIIGGRPAMAPVPANAGPVAVQTRQLYADSAGAASAIAAPIAPNGGSAAVAAGVLGFAAVGLLVAMRIVFKGAIS